MDYYSAVEKNEGIMYVIISYIHIMLNLNCRTSAGRILSHMCKKNETDSSHTQFMIIYMRLQRQYIGGLEGHKGLVG